VTGAGVLLIPRFPLVHIMVLSQVVNGVVLPFVLIFMLLLTNVSPARSDSPVAVTPDQFEIMCRMIKPNKFEWNWTEIPWAANLWDARRQAADEGKPLFVWSMDGEPLGQC
jgi:hypothetical protein